MIRCLFCYLDDLEMTSCLRGSSDRCGTFCFCRDRRSARRCTYFFCRRRRRRRRVFAPRDCDCDCDCDYIFVVVDGGGDLALGCGCGCGCGYDFVFFGGLRRILRASASGVCCFDDGGPRDDRVREKSDDARDDRRSLSSLYCCRPLFPLRKRASWSYLLW